MHATLYMQVTIVTVPPRSFPFATLAARCSASTYRLLQSRTRKRWGCALSPSEITAAPPQKDEKVAPVEQDETDVSITSNQAPPGLVHKVDPSKTVGFKSTGRSGLLLEKALWVFDEDGILRILQEPLSMQDRLGKGRVAE